MGLQRIWQPAEMQRIFLKHIKNIICGGGQHLGAIPVANALLECEYSGELMDQLYRCLDREKFPKAEPELATMVDECLQKLNIHVQQISEKITAMISLMGDYIDEDGANKMANLFMKIVEVKNVRTFILLASDDQIVRAIAYLQRTHWPDKFPDACANLRAVIEKFMKERAPTQSSSNEC